MMVETIRKSIHPEREHIGHRRQPMPQRARKLHLTHCAGMADVLRRRHFRGHRITIGTPPLTLSQGTGSPDKQLRHCGQPLCDRRRLIPRGHTHHIDEVAVRRVFARTSDDIYDSTASNLLAASQVVDCPVPGSKSCRKSRR